MCCSFLTERATFLRKKMCSIVLSIKYTIFALHFAKRFLKEALFGSKNISPPESNLKQIN